MPRSLQLEKMHDIRDAKFGTFKGHNQMLDDLYDDFENIIDDLCVDEVSRIISTLYNWIERKKDISLCEENLSSFHCGDIVMCDYGLGFYDEVGYYHAGLILGKQERKYLIVPITSSAFIFNEAAIYRNNNYMILPTGSSVIGKVTSNSTLVLNDMKWVSASRLFKSIGKMDVESDFYKYIKAKAIEMIQA